MAIRRQDKISPRTPEQLQRQYDFDKTFAEIRGVANNAQSHAEAAEKTVKTWSQTLETDFSDIRTELSMKLEKDKDGNLIGSVHIGANQLTIDTDNFKLSALGVVNATAGYIGGWEIRDGALYAEAMDGEYQETTIAPGVVYLHTETIGGHRAIKLEGGGLSIEQNESGAVMPSFATFTFNGTTYSLCIDFNDNNRLYAYERSDD